MTETNKRLGWIDTARGLAMLAIYHFHTEVYYTGEIVTDYDMYVENACRASSSYPATSFTGRERSSTCAAS